jgi:hypothetical protein
MGTILGPFLQRFWWIALEGNLIEGVDFGQMLSQLLYGLTLALYLEGHHVIPICLSLNDSVKTTYPGINPRSCQDDSPSFIQARSGQPELAAISDIAIITS